MTEVREQKRLRGYESGNADGSSKPRVISYSQAANANQNYKQKKNKNQKSTPHHDANLYREESVLHWNTGGVQKKLKTLCMGGSDTKIGCSWDQFNGDKHEAMLEVCRQLGDFTVGLQHDNYAKSSYFLLEDVNDAKEFMNQEIYVNDKKVEFYQTVKYAEDVTVIKVPNFKDINPRSYVKKNL